MPEILSIIPSILSLTFSYPLLKSKKILEEKEGQQIKLFSIQTSIPFLNRYSLGYLTVKPNGRQESGSGGNTDVVQRKKKTDKCGKHGVPLGIS